MFPGDDRTSALFPAVINPASMTSERPSGGARSSIGGFGLRLVVGPFGRPLPNWDARQPDRARVPQRRATQNAPTKLGIEADALFFMDD